MIHALNIVIAIAAGKAAQQIAPRAHTQKRVDRKLL